MDDIFHEPTDFIDDNFDDGMPDEPEDVSDWTPPDDLPDEDFHWDEVPD